MNPNFFTPLTQDSPLVVIDGEDGIFKIIGRSVTHDPIGFFTNVMTAFDKTQWRTNEIDIVIQLEYISTQSARMILRLLQMADRLHLRGSHKVQVTWFCEEEDESLIDDAQDYKDLLNMPFDIKMVSEEDYDANTRNAKALSLNL